MKRSTRLPCKRLIASAVMMALAGTVSARSVSQPQSVTPASSAKSKKQKASSTKKKSNASQASNMETVVVTGYLKSIQASLNIKRYGTGFVDGITAEALGKFPASNLAESLQRVPGVSISRVNGEGSRVTVRGIGPQYNLVLLNGRLMPTANIAATTAPNDRSFDFAQLAPDGIAEVDVYKSATASTPSGGLGATINVVTPRPFDNPGLHGGIGVKGVWDTSNQNIPDSLQYGKEAPQIDGIFSDTFDDGRFGIGLTGSYQERYFGSSQAGVTGGWHAHKGTDTGYSTIPLPGQPGAENITNRPGPGDIYSLPQNLQYTVTGNKEQRTNGQLTLQYKPIDSVVTTLDYEYSDYKIRSRHNELSAYFVYGPSASNWTNGPVAAPLVYSEIINPATSDIAMAGGEVATEEKLRSAGFNTKWKVNDALNFTLDYHHSTASNHGIGPYGSNVELGTAAFERGTTTVDFSKRFPVLNIQLPPGQTKIDPAAILVTGSSFRNSAGKSTVDQFQLNGNFIFPDYSQLDFGVDSTDVHNTSEFSNVQLNTWGGATSPDDYPDSYWHSDHIGQYFNEFSGHNDSDFTDQFFTWNFAQVRQRAEDAWVAAGHSASDYRASPNFTTDQRTKENTHSAYVQWSQVYNIGLPLHVNAGLRYENTLVTSSALVPTPYALSWGSVNEYNLLEKGSGFTTLRGSYHYVLPELNLKLDLSDSMAVRAAYGETIGRPSWNQIQGGQTLNQLVRIDGGTGTQGNPGLKPLLSRNVDLGWAWYYDKNSYVSADIFHKSIKNYVGTTQVTKTPFNIHTPVDGAYWNAAVASGACVENDAGCIRQYILANDANKPGVTVTGTDSTGDLTGTIIGQPGDPLTPFRITTPANSEDTSLYGWEGAIQQVWHNGIGVSATFTVVKSPLHYDNHSLGQQFALVGLGNTADFQAFYQKGPWQARVAFNWRGTFLSGLFDGAGPNPVYTRAYGQVDVSASYHFNKHFSLNFQGININNETQYLYSRNIHQLEYATQVGARYLIGGRYDF